MMRYDTESEHLKPIFAHTLANYEQNAKNCWKGTCEGDVSQNIAVLLKNLAISQPLICWIWAAVPRAACVP